MFVVENFCTCSNAFARTCSSSDTPEKFAEQAMEAISREDDKSLNGSNNVLVIDEMVNAMLDSVEIPDNLVEKYFQIGEPFFRWELMEKVGRTANMRV